MLINDTEIYKFNAKDSKTVAASLLLGNISKDWSVDNMKKKTGLRCYVYDFSVDVDEILDIHKCLIKKKNIIRV